MKLKSNTKKTLVALLLGILTLLIASCSDDSEKVAHNPFDHSHDETVTDMVKHKFEHQFADECVAREARNSPNKEEDRARLEKPCMCIAKFLMKDLTAKEAEIFLKEHKNTQSLRIRFDNAAYHCLQQSQQKGPKLFGKP